MSTEARAKDTLRPVTMDEAKIIVDNDTYRITDLYLYDTRGRIVYTISTTILRIGRQTRGHAHPNDSEVYEFLEGEGIMMIDYTAINVKAGQIIFVEKTRTHKVINTSQASELIFRCYFAGEIRRPHLKL
jgi:mannose-6-phosphate isomerase-like protein (cupin superfamily)